MIKALAVVILAAVAAGAFFWFQKVPQSAPVPLAQVRGSSFDVDVKPEAPKPVEIAAPEAKPAVTEVKVEAKPVEVKPLPPEPRPVVVPAPEVKPEPKPEPNPEPKPDLSPVANETKAKGEPKTETAPAAEVKPASAAPPAAVAAEAKPVDDKPMLMTFSKLAFRYWPQTKDKGARDPFPKEIRALNGKKVIMDGFMFPIDFEKGKVRSFILSNGMFGCCFGDAPSITETIKVYRADGKLMPYQSMARVTGILEVGEEFDGDGYVDSVYRIKAEDVGASQIEHK